MTTAAPDEAPGRVGASWKRRLLPVDACVLLYLAATGVLLLANAGQVDRPLPVVFRITFLVALVVVLRSPAPASGFLRFLRLAYPVFLYPLFYEELDILNRLVTTTHFDPVIVDIERALFRSQPSVSLREWLPQPWIAEILHFCYVSYYAFAPLVFIRLGFKETWDGVAETATVVTATFVACYVWFIAFPVTGPFHHFSPPDPRTLGYLLPEVTHWILHRGSSVGTAFPSSHVAIAPPSPCRRGAGIGA